MRYRAHIRKFLVRLGVDQQFALATIRDMPKWTLWRLWKKPEQSDWDKSGDVAVRVLVGAPCPFPEALAYSLTQDEYKLLQETRTQKVRQFFVLDDPVKVYKYFRYDLLLNADFERLGIYLAVMSGRRAIDLLTADFGEGKCINGVDHARISQYRKTYSEYRPPYEFPLLCPWREFRDRMQQFRAYRYKCVDKSKVALLTRQVQRDDFIKTIYFPKPCSIHKMRALYAALLPLAHRVEGVTDAEVVRRALHHKPAALTHYVAGPVNALPLRALVAE